MLQVGISKTHRSLPRLDQESYEKICYLFQKYSNDERVLILTTAARQPTPKRTCTQLHSGQSMRDQSNSLKELTGAQ